MSLWGGNVEALLPPLDYTFTHLPAKQAKSSLSLYNVLITFVDILARLAMTSPVKYFRLATMAGAVRVIDRRHFRSVIKEISQR